MANYFPAVLERGRAARPPYAPYVVTDSPAAHPWLPADETHGRAPGKWEATQRTPHRRTGNKDLPIGRYVLHLLRYISAGDLTGARSEFGGLTAQLNHLAVAAGLSITDHAGIAATYDFRTRRAVRKLVKYRPKRAGYFEFLSNIDKGIKSGAVRDFEARAEEMEKEKEKAV